VAEGSGGCRLWVKRSDLGLRCGWILWKSLRGLRWRDGWLGFVWLFLFSRGLEFEKLFERAVIGAIERGFVADDQGQAGAALGEVLEHPGDAVVVADIPEGPVDDRTAVCQMQPENIGFDTDDPVEPPAGDGHGFDGVVFDNTLRFERVEIGVEEDLEIVWRFAGDNDGLRAESVAGGIGCGFGFAFGSDGASGLGAVEAGGIGFEFTWHVGG